MDNSRLSVNKTRKRVKKAAENPQRPITSSLTTDERLRVIANLIVDRLLSKQDENLLGIKK